MTAMIERLATLEHTAPLAAGLVQAKLADPAGRFAVEDLYQEQALRSVAQAYAQGYQGDFAFMLDMRAAAQRGALSPAQAKGTLNCLLAELRRERERCQTEEHAVPAEAALAEEPSPLPVPDGDYRLTNTRDERTLVLRLSPIDFGSFPLGTRKVEVVTSRRALAFAHITPDGLVRRWRRAAGLTEEYEAVLRLLALGPGQWQGVTIAVEQAEGPSNGPALVEQLAAAPLVGTFTVVQPEGRTTLRIQPLRLGRDAGKLGVSFLAGPNNEGDYRLFAVVDGEQRLTLRAPYTAELAALAALRVFIGLSQAEQFQAGESYALESGRCWRCGRTLTTPESIRRGIGPDCAGKLGLA